MLIAAGLHRRKITNPAFPWPFVGGGRRDIRLAFQLEAT
jgi:hypothetical protein